MAPRVSHLLCFFLSSLLLLLLLSQATCLKLERFGSFKHLEGSKKGDKREGIQKVKQYLHRYGYSNNSVSHPQYKYSSSSSDSSDDDFDDALESSLKAFQRFYHLSPTGILDSPTAALMSQPRCGFPDLTPSGNGIHPDYALWDGQKWPSGHMNIHYIVFPDGHPEEAIRKGFEAWAGVSNFTFERVRDEKFAEVRVHFIQKDGRGGTLGSASPLPNPEITFDKEECWVDGAEPDCYDLQSTATHEAGHILGLGHSQDPKAVMFPTMSSNETVRDLTQDDINGIRAKYST